MEAREHWEQVYQTKAPTAVSWYTPHLEASFNLIKNVASNLDSPIIDVGGGESTLVDDLLLAGYTDISILDISQTAIDVARMRLGNQANLAKWIADDITQASLPRSYYEVWHDRAVFHFLTDAQQRLDYVRQVSESVKVGGHIIISTFGPEGPVKCSGLDVVRYNSESLHEQFGKRFKLIDSKTQIHHAPSGAAQQFLYCYCRLESKS